MSFFVSPLTIGAVVAVAIAVTGCGSTSNSSSRSGSSGAPGRELVLIEGRADAVSVTVGYGARAEARKLGYPLSVRGSAGASGAAQIAIINSVTAAKPGAVLIAPADRHALIAPIQSMKSAGIKVIEINTTVDAGSIAREPYQEGVDGVRRAVAAITGNPTRNVLPAAAR